MAHAVLDRCMTDNATEENPDIVNSKNYEVTFDFEFLEDWRPQVARTLRGRLSRLTRRQREVGRSTDNLDVKPLDVASSVDSSLVAGNDEEKQAVKWKPEGFSRAWHPLSLMVSEEYI